MKSESTLIARRVTVIGFARTGVATAHALRARGIEVITVDDHPTEKHLRQAAETGATFLGAPNQTELFDAIASSELVVVSPGIPPKHPVFGLVTPHRVIAEIELAARLTDIPIVAVTGTNGKTTVTTLIAAMLNASGIRASAVGNIGRAFIEALDEDPDVFVCEVSSFQLAGTSTFHPLVAVWLNFAEDHLDWHDDLDAYAASKARSGRIKSAAISRSRIAGSNRHGRGGSTTASTVLTFGEGGSYRIESDEIVGPDGVIFAVDILPRRLPHDIDNALAALAAAISAGAQPSAAVEVLAAFGPLPHRVVEIARLRWSDVLRRFEGDDAVCGHRCPRGSRRSGAHRRRPEQGASFRASPGVRGRPSWKDSGSRCDRRGERRNSRYVRQRLYRRAGDHHA